MSVPMPDCPTCGHNSSAFAGACTAFVLEQDGSVGYCGHDCSVDLFGESVWDRVVRAFQQSRWDAEPLPHDAVTEN